MTDANAAAAPKLADAFREAVFRGDLAKMQELVAAGQLEARDGEGNTPLACSCRGDHYAVTRYLLEQGANPNTANILGNTPLMEAALTHQGPTVKLLLEHGADPDQSRVQGETALMMTVTAGDRESAVYLIEAGANIYRQTTFGQDAMMRAHSEGYKEMAGLIRDTATARDARIAAEKQAAEHAANMSGIAAHMDGGLERKVRVGHSLQLRRQGLGR